MEDDGLTQKSTQLQSDPRRHGVNSMLSEDDECDVLCILHPGSPAAYQAVALNVERTPQHILQNQGLSHNLDDMDGSKLDYDDDPDNPGQNQHSASEYRDDMLGHGGTATNEGRGIDIALRLSSQIQNPSMGFTFGRRPQKCDLLLSKWEQYDRKISGMHFRIYLNKSGVLMVEDTSTNGTIVDSVVLTRHNNALGVESRRMISPGSIIEVLLHSKNTKKNTRELEVLKFIVSIPSRDHVGDRWGQNLAKYLAWLDQTDRQATILAQAAAKGQALALPPIPLNPLGDGPKQPAVSDPATTRTLAAGSEAYRYGMEWNGGDQYNVVGYIGKGAFAIVYKLAMKRDGELFAVKQIEKRRFVKNGILDRKINNEIHIMKNLSHPNIVKYVGHHDSLRHLYIIMEYVPGGDLTVYINSGTAMAEYMGQSVAYQICQALDYLHKSNITHRDIKPDNILIETEDPLVVKLSDFGLSKVITNEDTILKTFCGTILYCAPEIYPGYDRYKSGLSRKRTRSSDPPLKTSPYQQSVDIWAFAAVLYHLLCGAPPFEGSFEDRGASMLETVMTTPVEYGRLKNLGVSAAGIDFISRMLVLDPAARLTEAECLKHAWITGIEGSARPELEMQGVSNTLDVIEESADELDASQLSLVDNPRCQEIGDSNEDLDTELDEIADTRTSKRFKLDGLGQRQLSEMPLSGDIAYPSLPRNDAPSQRSGNSYAPTNRLFGEIGASALRSSGVLGHNVHVALQMPFEESSAEDSFNTSESQALTHMADGPITSNDGTTKENVQYPQALPASEFTGSASSLLGTEALVGQLNMASLESGASAPSPESTHAPKTPKSREASPLSASAIQGSKRSSQVFHSQSDHQTTPKRAKVNQSGAPSQLSQHIDALPQGSDQGLSGESSTQKVRNPSNPPVCTNSKREGTPDNAESVLEDKDRVRSIKSVRIDNLTSTEAEPSHPEPALSSLSDTSDIIANAGSTFVRPLPRFGVLTTVPGSFCTTTIKLEQRITYYGREPMSHVLHPDKLDRRVPKNALDIIFWRPGIEKLLQEGKDWSTIEALYAIVHTRTSRSIKINGVKLTKGEGCWNFGRLHTGDVITIFEPPENEVVKGNTTEYLKFRCEFFLGLSAKPREDGSVAFVVEKEEEKFMLNQMRKSQGSLGSQASEENDKEDSQGSSKIGPPQALPGSGSQK